MNPFCWSIVKNVGIVLVGWLKGGLYVNLVSVVLLTKFRAYVSCSTHPEGSPV